MEKEIIKLIGPKPGPVSIVMAGNHGNEKCGVKAFEELIPNLQIDCGTVMFILGNVNALVVNTRFTEANLNRMFKPYEMLADAEKYSYEYFRAQYLKQYFAITSAILDIHSSSTIGSPPFVICEQNAFAIAKNLPVEAIVYGFASANPGGVYSYVNSIGGTGIAIECGQHDDPNAKNIACKAIMSFLFSRGHVEKNSFLKNESPPNFFEAYLIYKSKTDSFKKRKQFKDFEKVAKGEIVGFDGEEEIYAPENSIILFAQDGKNVGDEVFVLSKIIQNH